jgi:DNA-binding NarL/FixJ family response regulator
MKKLIIEHTILPKHHSPDQYLTIHPLQNRYSSLTEKGSGVIAFMRRKAKGGCKGQQTLDWDPGPFPLQGQILDLSPRNVVTPLAGVRLPASFDALNFREPIRCVSKPFYFPGEPDILNCTLYISGQWKASIIMPILKILLVDDHGPLRMALREGLQATGLVQVLGEASTGQEAIIRALELDIDVILMDVQLQDVQAGRKAISGVAAAVAIRRERPRLPVVFYSIQDDDEYYREFRASGILTHYAYVRKSNYLLPSMLVPLLRDAVNGRSLVDPEIEDRVQEVRDMDEQSPRALLEPNELRVAELVAQGMTNEQIASRLNLHDKRAVSRTNGRIYAAWGLSETAVDDKVARARATLIFTLNRMIIWDEDGVALVRDRRDDLVPLYLETQTNTEHETLHIAETVSMTGVSTREDDLRKRVIRRVRYNED